MENEKSRGDTQTHKQQSDLASLCLFFQNKESRLKMSLLQLQGLEHKCLQYY
jgi:hypothetical protein